MMANPFDEVAINDYVGFQDKCREIAIDLFSHYCIKCNEKEYYFAEIEFYYWDKNNWNEKWNRVTYPRICNAGNLFYHLSGIDICFDSYYNEENLNDEARFGGILIRAIRCEDGIVVAGPWNCMLKLLNECKDGCMPQLRLSKKSCIKKEDIKQTYRALGEDDKKEDKNRHLELCFYDAKIKEWNQKKVRLNKKSGSLEEYRSNYKTERFDSLK